MSRYSIPPWLNSTVTVGASARPHGRSASTSRPVTRCPSSRPRSIASKRVDFPVAFGACRTFRPSANGPTSIGSAKHFHPWTWIARRIIAAPLPGWHRVPGAPADATSVEAPSGRGPPKAGSARARSFAAASRRTPAGRPATHASSPGAGRSPDASSRAHANRDARIS